MLYVIISHIIKLPQLDSKDARSEANFPSNTGRKKTYSTRMLRSLQRLWM